MSDPESFLVGASCLFALGCALLRVVGGAKELLRRGYSRRETGNFLVSTLAVLALLSAGLSSWLLPPRGDVDPWGNAVSGPDPYALGIPILAFAIGAMLLVPLLTAAMPRQATAALAAPAKRRWPLHVACYLGAGVLVAYEAFRYLTDAEPGAFELFRLALSWYCIVVLVLRGRRLQRQFNQPRILREVVASDPRPPVLYLREFAREQAPFVKSALSAFTMDRRPGLRDDLSGFETLEDFIGDAVDRAIGPWVALGGPEDILQPLGAAREYAADAAWKQRFESLVQQAQALVLHPGDSRQLTWEIAHVLHAGQAAKLFVIIGPLTFSGSLYVNLIWRMQGQEALPTWARFQADMQRAGYQMPAEPPSPSGLIVFDGHGVGSVIFCQFEPPSYVLAMQDHMGRAAESG